VTATDVASPDSTTSESHVLRTTHNGATTTLTITRDDKRNSLSAQLVDELLDAVESATDRGSTLLILRGEGRCFSAGFDFTDFDRASEGDLLLRFVRIELLLQTLAHAPMTTAALAHGTVFGAGADLVASCTHRICDPSTTFRMPGLRFGLLLGTRRLADRTNPDWAHDILESSRTFDAIDALHSRFVTEVLPTDCWAERIDCLATQADSLDRVSARSMRDRLITDTRDADLAAVVRSAARPGLVDRIRRFREG
jgi:enoyl-CoA hydratase